MGETGETGDMDEANAEVEAEVAIHTTRFIHHRPFLPLAPFVVVVEAVATDRPQTASLLRFRRHRCLFKH